MEQPEKNTQKFEIKIKLECILRPPSIHNYPFNERGRVLHLVRGGEK
jgi:hypothetical protein